MSDGKPIYQPIDYPEIVVGLVGPLGTDLKFIAQQIETAFQDVNYNTITIKLSDALQEFSDSLKFKLKEIPVDARINSYMDAGNKFRNKTDCKDVLATLAAGQIRQKREEVNGDPNATIPKTLFLLNSIKNKDEVETLRSVYGKNFFLISVYSPREIRKENLAKRISVSRRDGLNYTHYYNTAEELIERDLKEEENAYGQNVRGAFPLADLFIKEGNKSNIKNSIKRFVNCLFGYPFATPTKDEMGMFHAFGVALRSSDLSRQVGAAILSSDGDIITHGCNEVPKYLGGMYWEDDEPDGRDFSWTGYDSSAAMKKEIIVEVIDRFASAKILKNTSKTPEEIAHDILYGKNHAILDDATITNILEYGRIIHAEMSAITDASKRGLLLQGSTLYCTTYPCHICARHIIASGITRVVYVEPYPKSKAASLYNDSLKKDPHEESPSHVNFIPFVGIAPRRFEDFFGMVKRKEKNGDAIVWHPSKSKPRIKTYYPSYLHREAKLYSLLMERMIDKKINFSS